MEYWWFCLLTFIFGYITCKTFYLLRSARTTLILLKASQVIYLSTIIKAIENLSYSREIMLEHMLRTEKGSNEISSFQYRFDHDVEHLQKQSINVLMGLHPPFFRSTVDFEDWPSAMKFLTNNSESALKFWERA